MDSLRREMPGLTRVSRGTTTRAHYYPDECRPDGSTDHPVLGKKPVDESTGFSVSAGCCLVFDEQTSACTHGEFAAGGFAFSQNAYDEIPDLPVAGDLKPVSQSLLNLGQKLQQNDQAFSRLKSLYSILSYTNKTIIRVEPPQVIYESFCQIAVTHGCFSVAWIGEVRAEIGVSAC